MSCLMEGCTNTKRLCKNTSVTFFGFPNIPALRAKWMWACNVQKAMPKKPCVCSEHFFDTDIVRRNDLPSRLVRDAFPLPPEGSQRRKIALTLGNDNTMFVKRSSSSPLLNSGGLCSNANSGAVPIPNGEDILNETTIIKKEFEASDNITKAEMQSLSNTLQLNDVEKYIVQSDGDEGTQPIKTNQYFKCCVKGCPNVSTNSDLKFYKFRTDQFSRSRWCEAIGMQENLVHSNTKICANHFVYPVDFKRDGNLEAYSVPSVNIPGAPVLVQHIMPIRTRKS